MHAPCAGSCDSTSASALEYLDRIVALCREKRIEVLLVSVPFTTPENDELNRQAVLNGMSRHFRKRP